MVDIIARIWYEYGKEKIHKRVKLIVDFPQNDDTMIHEELPNEYDEDSYS